jgi:hypothetical protein
MLPWVSCCRSNVARVEPTRRQQSGSRCCARRLDRPNGAAQSVQPSTIRDTAAHSGLHLVLGWPDQLCYCRVVLSTERPSPLDVNAYPGGKIARQERPRRSGQTLAIVKFKPAPDPPKAACVVFVWRGCSRWRRKEDRAVGADTRTWPYALTSGSLRGRHGEHRHGDRMPHCEANWIQGNFFRRNFRELPI